MDTQTKALGIKFFRHEDAICEVQYNGQCLPTRARAITKQIETYITEHNCSTGVLLNVSANPMLSVIRLSSLIEILSTLQVPLAIVFGSQHQCELANLLHYTFIKSDHIGYFTALADACAFLRTTTVPPSP